MTAYEKVVEQNVMECWDEDTKEFDWDTYQYLCDIYADKWDDSDYYEPEPDAYFSD